MSEETSTIFIDKLNLRLPTGLQGRENTIARLAAKELAELALTSNLNLSEMSVPKLTIQGTESNRTIARKIAQAVGKQINHSNDNKRAHQQSYQQHPQPKQQQGTTHAN